MDSYLIQKFWVKVLLAVEAKEPSLFYVILLQASPTKLPII